MNIPTKKRLIADLRIHFAKSFLFMILLFFSSCKFENYIEMYYSDILEFLEGKEQTSLKLPITLNLEVGGSDSCNEKKQNIIAQIDDYIEDSSEGDCLTKDSTTYLQVTGKVPLVKDHKSLEDKSYLIAFSVKNNKELMDFSFHLNSNSYYRIKRYVKDEFWSSMEIKDFSVEIDFQNDKNNPIQVKCYSCYLNGNASPFEGSIELNKREEAKMKLSAVLIENILDNGSARSFSVMKKEILKK